MHKTGIPPVLFSSKVVSRLPDHFVIVLSFKNFFSLPAGVHILSFIIPTFLPIRSTMIAGIVVLGFSAMAQAHVAAWAKGMYCLSGTSGNDDQNTNNAVGPLYMLDKSDWWFQHDRGCDKFPPAQGDFLELPANGNFTVELAHNRAQTTLSYDGQYTGEWPDSKDHPTDWKGPGNPPGCIQDDGAMHTNNQSMAAGTAFAISYESDLAQVTMENLVVFSVLEQ
jgi:hypothetical protein